MTLAVPSQPHVRVRRRVGMRTSSASKVARIAATAVAFIDARVAASCSGEKRQLRKCVLPSNSDVFCTALPSAGTVMVVREVQWALTIRNRGPGESPARTRRAVVAMLRIQVPHRDDREVHSRSARAGVSVRPG